MKPTRRSQPYRKGSMLPGPSSMYAGRTGFGTNPQDTGRSLAKALKRKPRRRPPAGKLAARLRGR